MTPIDDKIEVTAEPVVDVFPDLDRVSEENTVDTPVDEISEIVEQSEEVVSEKIEGGEDEISAPESLPQLLGKVEEIIGQLSVQNGKLDSLQTLFDARIRYSDYEEKVREEMHRELQEFKDDFYAKLFKPILMDIITIRKDILKMAAHYQAKPVEEQNIPLKKYLYPAEDLADLLDKYSVTYFNTEPGTPFNPRRHSVSEKVITDDESLDKMILRSVSDGYLMNDCILVYERVKVYSYVKPKDESLDSDVRSDTM